MRGNINNLMKQAQAMQANMQKAQAEIATIEVIGESGGGMVKITMTGKHEVKRVQIEPSVAGEDREMLEDLIAAAMNEAGRRVDDVLKTTVQGMMGGLNLPPGLL
jgi:DNA-binding YbaB/EbfC family protein